MLGVGLALVQGNAVMARGAVATVGKGFLAAFAIALTIGFVVPDWVVQSEMTSRGSPGLVDLLVAFCSGVCAAYAIGRPNLVSALPGVAIAAALVPPIATAGLATAAANTSLALGAILLFVTNFLAIVLGAAVSHWCVGIRGGHEHGRYAAWASWAAFGLVIGTLWVAVIESTPVGLVDRLRRAVDAEVTITPGYRLVAVEARREEGDLHVVVVLRSDEIPPPELRSRIAAAVESIADTPTAVDIEWRHTFAGVRIDD